MEDLKIEKIFPVCFPDNFILNILPEGNKEQELKVFRLCKFGIIDKEAFLSTHEEVLKELRPPNVHDNKEDPGYYSTSCDLELTKIKKAKKFFMRHNPKTLIAKGITVSCLGPSQESNERKRDGNTHVDWWIYRDAYPHNYFEEVTE